MPRMQGKSVVSKRGEIRGGNWGVVSKENPTPSPLVVGRFAKTLTEETIKPCTDHD